MRKLTALLVTLITSIITPCIAQDLEKATFGAGCFWCTETIFEQLKGVESVSSGYTGGNKVDPTYKEVCTGRTGHAEVTMIQFNPEIISYSSLLEIFWEIHDPTTLFFFQAEDGIRDKLVTGVQTCALPISLPLSFVFTSLSLTSSLRSFPGRSSLPVDCISQRSLYALRSGQHTQFRCQVGI